MEREDLFHRTLKILTQAFLNGTLEIGNPCACAVGNMVAKNMGIEAYLHHNSGNNKKELKWRGALPHWWALWDKAQARRQIKATGYSPHEVEKIEQAFEREKRMHRGLFILDNEAEYEKYAFIGLVNVVDALIEIHRAGENHSEEAVSQFEAIKELKSIQV